MRETGSVTYLNNSFAQEKEEIICITKSTANAVLLVRQGKKTLTESRIMF